MAHETIISVSGLRGIIGESLDPILAIRFAIAFASQIEEGPILLSRDGRTTGPMIADAIASGLAAAGRDVIDADVCATPTTGVLVRALNCAGGIQISASHNPPEYNGIKLFGKDGRVINQVAGEKVIQKYSELDPSAIWTSYEKTGVRALCEDTISDHLGLVLQTIDVAAIQQKKFKVILDSNHGAGSVVGRELLSHLECDFEILGDQPDGLFDHTPEPTAENLSTTAQKIKAMNADVGFCQDPDADRLALIDEKGNYVGEEYTLAITLEHALSSNPGTVVINCATSRMSIDIAERNQSQCLTSAVGEANVSDMMIAKNAVYGGEGNGGPIDPRVGYVRDSIVAMAQTLDAMAATGKTISQLAESIPSYGMHKAKTVVERSKIPSVLDAIERDYPEAKSNRMDGLRLDWEDRWLLIRASNTEPIVRIIAECPTLDDAKKLCEDAAKIVAKV